MKTENISFKAGIGENLRLGIMRKFPKTFSYAEIARFEETVQNKTKRYKNFVLDVLEFDRLEFKYYKLTNKETKIVADDYLGHINIREPKDITVENVVKIIKGLKKKYDYLSKKEKLDKKYKADLKNLYTEYNKSN